MVLYNDKTILRAIKINTEYIYPTFSLKSFLSFVIADILKQLSKHNRDFLAGTVSRYFRLTKQKNGKADCQT